MIKLKVKINGKEVCIAGEKDLSVLSAIISACGYLGPDSYHKFSEVGEKKITLNIGGGAGGKAREDYKDYSWLEKDIELGDKIELEFIDSSNDGTAPIRVQKIVPKTLEEVNEGLENCNKTLESCKEQIQWLEELKEKIISEQGNGPD